MLQERINDDLKIAMKNKDEETKSLLRVIIGDFPRIGTQSNDFGRNLSDDEVIRLLKKFKEEAIQMNNNSEVEILNRYLPEMLTTEKLEIEINEIIKEKEITSIKGMGIIMGELKRKFGISYDGKIASELIKKIF